MPTDNGSYVTVRVLHALKEAFTFKELEELLDIPSQVLWRYVNYLQFPEKETSKKILDVVLDKKLLESAVRKLAIGPQGILEDWRFMYNPRFLDIVGYVAWKHFAENGIDTVMTPSERDAPVATILADWLSAQACIASDRAWASWGRLISANYQSIDRGELIHLHVPRDAIPKEAKVLVVKGITRNFESLPALCSLIEQVKGFTVGVLVVVALSDKWLESAEKAGIKKTKVIIRRADNGFLISL